MRLWALKGELDIRCLRKYILYVFGFVNQCVYNNADLDVPKVDHVSLRIKKCVW